MFEGITMSGKRKELNYEERSEICFFALQGLITESHRKENESGTHYDQIHN